MGSRIPLGSPDQEKEGTLSVLRVSNVNSEWGLNRTDQSATTSFFFAELKFEYRGTKFETIPNVENPNDQNVSMTNTVLKSNIFSMFEAFEHSNFGFVSDLDIRIRIY
jgi:hypothetical protein